MRKLRQNSLNLIIHWSGVELSGGAYKCRFSQNTHSLGNYTTRFRAKHLKKTFQNTVSGIQDFFTCGECDKYQVWRGSVCIHICFVRAQLWKIN